MSHMTLHMSAIMFELWLICDSLFIGGGAVK